MTLKIYKKPNVTEANFNRGKFIYEETLEFLKTNSYEFSYIDYWHFALALVYMDEDSEMIDYCFMNAYHLNNESMCVILNKVYYGNNVIFKLLQNKLPYRQTILNDCIEIKKVNNDEISIVSDKLSTLIFEIQKNDQKYRKDLEYFKSNIDKQNLLDTRNQIIIDSLYSKHNKYIGKSMVGKEYEVTMWAVIQHSNIAMMKRYLPIIHQAVVDKELPIDPLKMLIDRIYTIETGFQIFGSQGGFEIASDSVIKEVKEKYNLKL